jgi:NTP-dependent ternary system trypsin peptidase co-occuring protein
MYTSVPFEDGAEFLVEGDAGGTGVVRATRADDAIKSSAETFENSLTRVRHVAEVIVDKLSGFPAAPTHIRAEFGISLAAESGMVILKGTGTAHFVIELEWSQKPKE